MRGHNKDAELPVDGRMSLRTSLWEVNPERPRNLINAGPVSRFCVWPDGVTTFWKVSAAQKMFAAVPSCAGDHLTAAFGAHIRGCVPLFQ